MPRHARFICPGVPHHVTQRGNHRAPVFFSNGDQESYLRMLNESAGRWAIQIIAYCLMPNHVHLVVVPPTADALHRVLKAAHGQYAQRINRMKNQNGHFWQGRYFSSPLDAQYLLNAVRYVELNPVRAGIVAAAEEYPWSSAAAHSGLGDDSVIAPAQQFHVLAGIKNWSRWLADAVAEDALQVLRGNTSQNLPCGSTDFVTSLEAVAGRNLHYRPHGVRLGRDTISFQQRSSTFGDAQQPPKAKRALPACRQRPSLIHR